MLPFQEIRDIKEKNDKKVPCGQTNSHLNQA